MLGRDDENAGRAALGRWLPRFLDAARADGAHLDSEGGVERALQLVTLAESEAAAARLALLPEALFARGRVDELASLALALQEVDRLAQSGVAGAGGKGRAPAPLAGAEAMHEEAEQVRTALFKLLDYHFGEDPAVAAELGDGKPKAGSFRFAVMLARLATLAEARSEVLARDPKYWRETLVADARRLAETLLGGLESVTEREALDLKRRAFGLLEVVFADVRAALGFVMRHEAAWVDALPYLIVKRPITRKVKVEATPAAS